MAERAQYVTLRDSWDAARRAPTIRISKSKSGMNAYDNNDHQSRKHWRHDERRTPRHLRLVAWHRVRVVRLLHLRHTRRHSGKTVLLRRQSDRGLHLHAAGLRGRLRGAAVWRAGVRAH